MKWFIVETGVMMLMTKKEQQDHQSPTTRIHQQPAELQTTFVASSMIISESHFIGSNWKSDTSQEDHMCIVGWRTGFQSHVALP